MDKIMHDTKQLNQKTNFARLYSEWSILSFGISYASSFISINIDLVNIVKSFIHNIFH